MRELEDSPSQLWKQTVEACQNPDDSQHTPETRGLIQLVECCDKFRKVPFYLTGSSP
uniref:Uncharacterized protein n=1 Tax=Anguilla anguilla TaxID=7936 RepID=A0A0E9SX87_ANGAN